MALTTDTDGGIRAVALDTLGSLCGDSKEEQERLLPHLQIGLVDPSWRVRQIAGEEAAAIVDREKDL